MLKLKIIALIFLAILFAFSSSGAHSGADMDMLALSITQQVKTLNEQNVWRLYSSVNKTSIDMFYDSKNIQSPYSGFKIVTTKMKYKDKSFLNKLKKGRKLHHQVMGADSEKLNYKDIDYTIQTFEVDCSQKEIRKEEVIADFDKNHNLLNLLPAVRRQFSPIRKNSSYEKLYNIVCKGN
jgi:hypothetical protein